MAQPPKFPDGKQAPKGVMNTTEAIQLKQLRALPPPKKGGRPKKLKMPPIPQEIYDGLSELEREHFDYCVQTIMDENPDLLASDMMYVYLAAMEYINTLRLQVEQLRTGTLVTMSRQHPAMQFRAWIDLLSVSRKQRPTAKTQDDAERDEWRKRLSELSS